MEYNLNLYSENTYTPVEEKQNERRFIFAAVLAILFHIALFIGAGFADLFHHKQPDEIKIINVQLHSERTVAPAAPTKGKQAKQVKQKPKSKPAKQESPDVKESARPAKQTKTETPAKQLPKPNTPAETKPDNHNQTEAVTAPKTQNTKTENSTIVPSLPPPSPSESVKPDSVKSESVAKTEQPAETQTKQPEPDIFEQMTRAADSRASANRQKWADTHAKNDSPAETAEDIEARESIGSVTAKKDSNSDNTVSGGQKGENGPDNNAADAGVMTDNNNISWSSGTSRRLVSSGDIEPPEEIGIMGIKTSVTIRFEVFDNGLIGKVEILKSAGDPEWDNNIAMQFKNKFKFEQGAGKAFGTIIIDMGY